MKDLSKSVLFHCLLSQDFQMHMCENVYQQYVSQSLGPGLNWPADLNIAL